MGAPAGLPRPSGAAAGSGAGGETATVASAAKIKPAAVGGRGGVWQEEGSAWWLGVRTQLFFIFAAAALVLHLCSTNCCFFWAVSVWDHKKNRDRAAVGALFLGPNALKTGFLGR